MDRVETDKFQLPARNPPGKQAGGQLRPAKDDTAMHTAPSVTGNSHV